MNADDAKYRVRMHIPNSLTGGIPFWTGELSKVEAEAAEKELRDVVTSSGSSEITQYHSGGIHTIPVTAVSIQVLPSDAKPDGEASVDDYFED